MYRSRYSGLTYAEKFESILHFFVPKEKVEEIGKMEKAERGEQDVRSMTSFFSSAFLPRPAEGSSGGRRRSLCRGQRMRKKGLFVLFLIRIAY
jgi:hypothetical protein